MISSHTVAQAGVAKRDPARHDVMPLANGYSIHS
jgi:hypothetical protein